MLSHDSEGKIKDITAGKVLPGVAGHLLTARNLLCASFTPDRTVKTGFEGKLLIKERQAVRLKEWAKLKECWIDHRPSASQYLTRGGESLVFQDTDKRHLIKLNNAVYYATWLEYLDSLAIHNIIFPDTAYTLMGFTESDGELYAVLRQPFILTQSQAELADIQSYLEHNGFEKTKRNDYRHAGLGLILEDMHDENVLVAEDLLFFVDTVFYIVDPAMFFPAGVKT
jgi:hypothetical protein